MKQILATLALLMAMAIPATAQMTVVPSCVKYGVTVQAFEEQGVEALVLRGEAFEAFAAALAAEGAPAMPPNAKMAVVANPDSPEIPPTVDALWVRIYDANGCHVGRAPIPVGMVRAALGFSA